MLEETRRPPGLTDASEIRLRQKVEAVRMARRALAAEAALAVGDRVVARLEEGGDPFDNFCARHVRPRGNRLRELLIPLSRGVIALLPVSILISGWLSLHAASENGFAIVGITALLIHLSVGFLLSSALALFVSEGLSEDFADAWHAFRHGYPASALSPYELMSGNIWAFGERHVFVLFRGATDVKDVETFPYAALVSAGIVHAGGRDWLSLEDRTGKRRVLAAPEGQGDRGFRTSEFPDGFTALLDGGTDGSL